MPVLTTVSSDRGHTYFATAGHTLLVPSLRDEMLTITNATGHPSLTLRAGFVEVSEARSDWAADPAHPMPNSRRRAACRTA